MCLDVCECTEHIGVDMFVVSVCACLLYRVLIKYFFFENFKIYSGLWPLSVFQRSEH